MTLNPFRRGQDPLPSGAASRVTAGGAPSISPCAHCHERKADVRLWRIPFVGLRPICGACTRALNEYPGYGITAV